MIWQIMDFDYCLLNKICSMETIEKINVHYKITPFLQISLIYTFEVSSSTRIPAEWEVCNTGHYALRWRKALLFALHSTCIAF